MEMNLWQLYKNVFFVNAVVAFFAFGVPRPVCKRFPKSLYLYKENLNESLAFVGSMYALTPQR